MRYCLHLALATALLALAIPAAAQSLPPGFDGTYAVTSLNPLLALDADAVVRLELRRFEVDGPGKATLRVRRAVTVMNADGRSEGELYIPYDDRLRRLKKLESRLYDAWGERVRQLKKDDQDDYSAISGYSLYEDSRIRVARLYHDAYPYTVEFLYELEYDGLIDWPDWYPQERGLPVAFARFEIEAPLDLEVRYLLQGDVPEPAIAQDKRLKTLTWQVSDLPAFDLEPFGPTWQEQVLAVHTAPDVFEIEGTRGSLRSWEQFARWYHALGEGRDALPPEARAEVQRRVAGVEDEREKVRRLYAYMQERTRYVSIQLGLGGWQPFDAAYVHERGYGDCKALTNYMQALLKEAGIPSFPALIRSGSQAPEVLPAFPSNQFNHVVLHVPMETDTLWLECTSPLKAFGHLGTFTEDRYALVVEPTGGRLVRTPRSRAQDNRQVHHSHVEVTPSGDATARVRIRYTGNQQDDLRHTLAPLSGREREAWLREYLAIHSFKTVSSDFSEVDVNGLTLNLSVTLKVPHYASRTGERLFLPMNFMQRWSYVPPPDEERSQPIDFFPYAFSDTDTVFYSIPDGFTVEALPDTVKLETSFGRYEAMVVAEQDGTLRYYRRVAITERTLPSEQYEAFRSFLRQIAQADRAQAVLRRVRNPSRTP